MYKKIKVQLTLSLIILFYTSIALALNSEIRFQNLSIEDGLQEKSVKTMLLDDTGFLWFGTEDGLFKYDGYGLKTFKHDLIKDNSLSGNSINIIIKDSKSNLWIGTRGKGLNHFNTKTERFTHYRHQDDSPNSISDDHIYSLLEDSQGHLWIGTRNGLNHFNTETNQFTHYRHQANNPNSLSNDSVRSIIEDNQGNLWFGTFSGLNHFNTKTRQFTQYRQQSNDVNSLSNDYIYSIIEDSQNNLWLGTRGGINHFDSKTARFSHYPLQDNGPNNISDNYVYSIVEDSQDNLWIGTLNGGLKYFNTKTRHFTFYRHQAGDANSLSHDSIYSIIEDNQGGVWVGTHKGLNYFNIKTDQFNHFRHKASDANSLSNEGVYSIMEDSNSGLWIGTSGGGLNYYNSKTNQFTHYRHQKNDPSSISGDYIFSIVEDRQGNLWTGTDAGLDYFNTETEQFTHYRHQPDDINSLSGDFVFIIIEDSQDNLWMGTNKGLNYFNTKTAQFTHYRHQVNIPNSLSNDNVFGLVEDRQGNLWIGTDEGLNFFNKNTKKFTHYRHNPSKSDSLSHDNVESIIEDNRGNLWIGTDEGLNLFNKKTEKFKRYTTQNGLPSNIIYGIEEDNQGFIWLTTNHGLSRLDTKTGKFQNYDVGDGLQSNEFSGNASFKSKSGELFFGGNNGFNRFYPENIVDDIQLPKVVITEMMLLNNTVPIIPINNVRHNNIDTTVSPSKNKARFSLNQVINETKAITLTYQENIVAFEFSALHFSNPKKNQYAYQLVGWNEDWVSTDYKNRRATFTNLPYGDYIFRVKASNADGYWNEVGTSLQIKVLPPPWKTWWAYTIYGLFLLSLVFTFIHSQRKKVIFERKVNAQLEDKVIERTSQLQYKTEELQKSIMMLEEMSLTDQLTGLKNRRFLLNNIENDILLVLRKYKSKHESNSNKKPEAADLIIFLIDLDHFKMVNDIHGHTAGDAVLVQIKEILEQVFRETDYLVRWGGEEFLVIARFTERGNAPELAERLRQTVENHDFDIGGNKILKKTCSIGFACYPFSTQDTKALTWQQVVDVADHCMYAAKKSNRNAWVGLYAKTNKHNEDLFTAVIEETQSLIQLDELKMLSSIAEIDQVIWMVGE
ncbi:MAG: diguanylate cyclase [Saccharospirillaceae bacterium]|nr:diguanylate cyclase [Colwellia sp.]NRB81383.1 diguanylate cyclase [Saccharospirillaceae bacterium]